MNKGLVLLGWMFLAQGVFTQQLVPYGLFLDEGYCQSMRAFVESNGQNTTRCYEVN